MGGFGEHYRGDVSEVTMGHETGLYIQGGKPATFQAAISQGSDAAATHDYTLIKFSAGSSTTDGGLFYNKILKVPIGMLIGLKLSFHAASLNGGGGTSNFANYQYTTLNTRVYTIVDHTYNSSDAATELKIVPALDNEAVITSSNYDAMYIHSLGLPTVRTANADFSIHADAASSEETSSIDQFIGLASFMSLPDTTVDLHRYHVVGKGRQVAVQQTGKVHHMGGSIEMPMHDPKWLYYSLGREVVSKDKCAEDWHADPTKDTTNVARLYSDTAPGATFIDVASSQSSTVRFGTYGNAAIGDYILISDATRVPTLSYRTPKVGIFGSTDAYFWPPEASGSTLASDDENFEWTESSECRRIVAIEPISDLGSGNNRYIFRIYLDDPLQFSHQAMTTIDSTDAAIFNAADTLKLRRYGGDASHPNDNGSNTSNASPHVHTTGEIRNYVHRLIFSGETLPSFCVEHSVRNRDVGSANASGEYATSTIGGTNDSQQLTRIFRGCKVVEWELSSTVDAELKYRCVFDALSCYTDTGRLEASNKGDRYTAHRMFQNTAGDSTSLLNAQKNRKISGIADGTEKPFMFYNGEVKAFGQSLGLVSAFELRGKTGVELFHTIQGNPIAESTDGTTGISLKQVPYGGTRNASIIREGREEFEMEIDIALKDATLYHQLRTHTLQSGTIGSSSGYIQLKFTKPVTGSTGASYATPTLNVIIDEYYITECPIPVPDDKGLLHTKIKLMPQNVKVTSMDALYHC